jgi:AhpD family alkylhydroperoxidase
MEELPPLPADVARAHPRVMKAYRELGEACGDAGPLDEKTLRLVKLALAIGAGSEGAVHSHARRAREAGASPEELEQVALLAITTCGFPRAMAGLAWIRDEGARRPAAARPGRRK